MKGLKERAGTKKGCKSEDRQTKQTQEGKGEHQPNQKNARGNKMDNRTHRKLEIWKTQNKAAAVAGVEPGQLRGGQLLHQLQQSNSPAPPPLGVEQLNTTSPASSNSINGIWLEAMHRIRPALGMNQGCVEKEAVV